MYEHRDENENQSGNKFDNRVLKRNRFFAAAALFFLQKKAEQGNELEPF